MQRYSITKVEHYALTGTSSIIIDPYLPLWTFLPGRLMILDCPENTQLCNLELILHADREKVCLIQTVLNFAHLHIITILANGARPELSFVLVAF